MNYPQRSPASEAICFQAIVSQAEHLRRRKAAEALHRKPDPMTARERAEREAESGECG